jgi:ABC-type multidrug transport system fused ATPase/permease subunit
MVYSDAPICLLDDPTSALDATMTNHVLEHCIHGILEEQRRTRVVVTNHLAPKVLAKADAILWLDNGTVRFYGPFDQLSAAGQGEFAAFLAARQAETAAADAPATISPRMSEDSSPPQAQPQPSSPSKQPGAANTTGAKDRPAASASDGGLVMAEDRQVGIVHGAVYARLFRAAHTVWVACTFVVFVLSQALSLGRDFYLAAWTQHDSDAQEFEPRHHNLSNALQISVNSTEISQDNSQTQFVVNLALLTFSFAFIVFGRAIMLITVGIRCSTALHAQAIHAVLYSPIAFFDVTPSGRLLNRFAKDTESVDVRIWESWRGFLDLLLPMLGTIVLVCWITPLFACVVPVLAVSAYRVQRYYRCSSRELKRLASIARSPMYDWFSCTLDGLPTIRAHELQEGFALESAARSDESNAMQYIQKICDRWLGTRLEMMGNVLCFAAMVLGVVQARVSAAPSTDDDGHADTGSSSYGNIVSPALIGLSLSSSMRLARITNYTVRQFTQLESEMTSAERVLHYVDLPTEATTPPGAAHDAAGQRQPNQSGGGQRLLDLGPPADANGSPQAASAALEFEGVTMRYRPGLPIVLKGVSFSVQHGEKLGVVGRTGSGKSSLIGALFRLQPLCGGRVLLGGVDTASYGVQQLRRALAICPQDSVIFSGTVRSNLDPFGQYTPAAAQEALARVGLRDVQLDSSVQEAGSNFSGGMRQMLCLARTLLRRSQLIVLDEATGSISPELDARFQAVLKAEFGHATLFVVAHRLQTVLDADQVLVMGAGRVLEHGPPAELLGREGGELATLAAELELPPPTPPPPQPQPRRQQRR